MIAVNKVGKLSSEMQTAQQCIPAEYRVTATRKNTVLSNRKNECSVRRNLRHEITKGALDIALDYFHRLD